MNGNTEQEATILQATIDHANDMREAKTKAETLIAATLQELQNHTGLTVTEVELFDWSLESEYGQPVRLSSPCIHLELRSLPAPTMEALD